MSKNPSLDQFADELDKLIDRCRSESDLTYAEAVGVMLMRIHTLCQEAEERKDDL